MDADRSTSTRTGSVVNVASDGAASENNDSDDHSGGNVAGNSDRWLILNPVSGEGNHADRVCRLAAERGLRVLETDAEGDAARFARDAVEKNVHELAVCGGDGTLKEVLAGLTAADVFRPHDESNGSEGTTAATDGAPRDAIGSDASGFDAPVLSVIPAGTANIFATDMGITGIEEGFSVFDDGEERRLDLGFADGDPFMKSCIAGLTANASSATSDDLKERFGSLAFVLTGVKRAAEFDPLTVEIEAHGDDGGWSWSGEVLCLVVGNARRYAGEIGQANVEDGLLDVTLVEEMPPQDVVTEAVARQLLGRETENVTRLKARNIEIKAAENESISFSLDGEIADHDRLEVTLCQRAVPVRVGPTYDPDPADPDPGDPELDPSGP